MSHLLGGRQGLKRKQRRFVILNRDGTIRHSLSHPVYLELLPRAAEGLRQMQNLGFGLIVITNQSDMSQYRCARGKLNGIHQRLYEF